MNYTAGISIDNGDEGRTAVMLSYNRKTNSDLVLSIMNVEGATVLGDDNRDLLATVNTSDDVNYTSIEFDVVAVYEGTEISDPFGVTGSLLSHQTKMIGRFNSTTEPIGSIRPLSNSELVTLQKMQRSKRPSVHESSYRLLKRHGG